MIKLVRGRMCINIATQHLRNDGRSGGMNALGDGLVGGLSISLGWLWIEIHLACVHNHPGYEVFDPIQIRNQQSDKLNPN